MGADSATPLSLFGNQLAQANQQVDAAASSGTH
jgi:hypothetical protein